MDLGVKFLNKTVNPSDAYRILLINTNCSWNKGSAAQVISTVDLIRKVLPNAVFTLFSDYYPELDQQACNLFKIKVVGCKRIKALSKHPVMSSLTRRFGYLIKSLLLLVFSRVGLQVKSLLNEVILEYIKSDFVIDLSGDSLSDYGCNNSIIPLLNDFIAVFLDKKIFVYSQSIGPFRKLTKPLVRFYLNRVKVVVVREKESVKILKALGYKKSIFLCPDVAFWLQPASFSRVKEILLIEGVDLAKSFRFVGVGTNLLLNVDNMYLELMAKLIDDIIEKRHVHIILIPHVINPFEYDDRAVAMGIKNLARNKSAITVIKGDYLPGEIKGVIGQCELFIGTRMHTNIASASMCVPTIAVGWSHKYHGIMQSLQLGNYIFDFKGIDIENLKTTIFYALEHSGEIRQLLCKQKQKMNSYSIDKYLSVLLE